MTKLDLSIIIANWNTRELLVQCLRSVFASETQFQFDVTVVDNGSTDGSVEEIRNCFPNVRLLVNEENLGFARANNRGIEQAEGRYILLLNSDTEIQQDTIETMIAYMDERPSVGASGCKVLLPNGDLDRSCKRGFPTPLAACCYFLGLARLFPRHPVMNRYHLGHLDPDEDHSIDSLTGAFMIVRRETIDDVGMLDSNYFMYGEDIDWCYRIRQHGWDIRYHPGTRIVHHKGGSNRHRAPRIVREFHRAMWRFYQTHYATTHSRIFNALVYLGISTMQGITLACNQIRRLRA